MDAYLLESAEEDGSLGQVEVERALNHLDEVGNWLIQVYLEVEVMMVGFFTSASV